MQWSVIKTGIERFDMLHAYGLGVLLATISGVPVTIEDQGVQFSLEGAALSATISVTEQFLEETVLLLPNEKEVQIWNGTAESCPFSIRLFDGLLAALMTIPGPKAFSVSDAVRRQQRSPETIARALEKVQKQVQRWKQFLQRVSSQRGWIADVLIDYQPHQPTIPCFAQKKEHEKNISILMAIDAFFCYDLRNMHNDAQMMEKTNVAVRETHYATLLVFIGASRFLRAQCLAADHVALFLPCASSMTVTAETALPLLSAVPYALEHALVLHWLQQFLASASSGERKNRILYQILQCQKAQQPLITAQGGLDDQWFQTLEQHIGRSLLLYWRCLLEGTTDASLEEQEQTVHVLLTQHLHDWLHLLTSSISRRTRNRYSQHSYHLKEVRQVTAMMHTPTQFPLSEFFDREEGVLCYGRALRLLGDYHRAAQHDLLDLLSQVRTREVLFPVLAHIGQECEFAKRKWKYQLVPTEKDARALCVDIDRYGVTLIVGMILLLSSVRYPKNHDEQGEEFHEKTDDEPSPSPPESIEILHLDPDQRAFLIEESGERKEQEPW